MCYSRPGVSVLQIFNLIVLLSAAAVSAGCSIGYRNHHESELLRLYRSDETHSEPVSHDGVANHGARVGSVSCETASYDADLSRASLRGRVDDRLNDPLDDIDPAWATSVLRVFGRDFGVPLDDIVPVNIYINCDLGSDEKSHFNRLTRSIVLKVGQAELPRIYVHEISHLFLNSIESFPPYWIDQGLAEYMESRYVGNPAQPWADLAAPGLDWSALVVRHIGTHESEDGAAISILKERLTRDAIDEGRGWSVPFIHYLFAQRWLELPLAQKIRLLLELDERDLEVLTPDFLEYCRRYSQVEEILGAH